MAVLLGGVTWSHRIEVPRPSVTGVGILHLNLVASAQVEGLLWQCSCIGGEETDN